MKKILLFIMLVLLTSACGSNTRIDQPNKTIPTPIIKNDFGAAFSPDTFTSVNIDKILVDLGIDISKIYTNDFTYWRPSKDFVNSFIYPFYKNFLDENKAPYSAKFDCDDFSRTFCTISQLYFLHTESNRFEQGISIGELYFKRDPDYSIIPFESPKNHAINVVIIDTGEVIFFEPQNGQEVMLTENEIKSIYLIKF